MESLPTVVLVGGPDVDARLELMAYLKGDFDVRALGASPTIADKFSAAGYGYDAYHLSRQVNPVADLLTVGQLVALFRRLRPHIVHTFDTKPGVWGCLAARLAGVPIVISTITGLGSLYSGDGLKTRAVRSIYQALQKMACSLSHLTIFQNREDARQFIAEGVVPTAKVRVIPGSGVSTTRFAPGVVTAQAQSALRDELGIQPDELVITMISRVIRSKGVLEFGQAAQQVCQSHGRVRFLLVGPEDTDSVDRLTAAELSELKQGVTWPGQRRDIPAVLALSDIFVLPSVYREGIPRVLLEAAAMGLPIITTNTPGCNDVVEEGINGYLVPEHDPAAIAQAVVRLIEQPALRQRFGQVSRQRATQRFDIAVTAAQIRSVYRHTLAQDVPMQVVEL